MKLLLAALLSFAAAPALAAAPSSLDAQFAGTVQPFVGKYCAGCHSGAQPTAQLDLKGYASVDQVKQDFARWQLLSNRLTAHEMPPKAVKNQPSDAERQAIVDFVHAV